MKTLLLLLSFCFCFVTQAQTPYKETPSCPTHLRVEILQQSNQTVYRLERKGYPKYPLGPVGVLMYRCPQIKSVDILVDAGVPLDAVLTALDGSAKNQIDKVLVFVLKNGFFIPLTVGDSSSKDPTN